MNANSGGASQFFSASGAGLLTLALLWASALFFLVQMRGIRTLAG